MICRSQSTAVSYRSQDDPASTHPFQVLSGVRGVRSQNSDVERAQRRAARACGRKSPHGKSRSDLASMAGGSLVKSSSTGRAYSN
jgi:hypothetical protein